MTARYTSAPPITADSAAKYATSLPTRHQGGIVASAAAITPVTSWRLA
jgi:hypothetical protein